MCILVARLLGSKVLLHPHCSLYIFYEQQGKGWQWFVRKIARLCHGIVGLSNEWKRFQQVVPECQVFYLPNAINLLNYADVGQEKIESKCDKPCLHILYLGHLGKAKGSFDLIDAAKLVLQQEHEVSFDLVGQEHTTGEIEQLTTEVVESGLEEFIHIKPAVTGAEKIDVFRSADVFVYPSYHEGMPMAVIEAMACGLPIIATNVGGLPDLINPGSNGLLVPVGQPAQLATAIHQLIVDPQMRHLMQVGSYRLAQENFDIEKLVVRLLGIYQTVLLPRQKTSSLFIRPLHKR
jgi:glycosyltransferase involved in cell wall biosynthesis